MAKVTITFETAKLAAPASFSYAVDEIHAGDLVAAVAAHPVHGQVAEQIMADTGQKDAAGNPIMGPATRMRAATFAEGLQSWSEQNVRDGILGAVNQYRVEKAKAIALAGVNVVPIKPVE